MAVLLHLLTIEGYVLGQTARSFVKLGESIYGVQYRSYEIEENGMNQSGSTTATQSLRTARRWKQAQIQVSKFQKEYKSNIEVTALLQNIASAYDVS